nr:nitrogenase iron protein NifH [uncultured Blautia sp.]
MIRIAVYGKGGIGKSTTVSNVAAALAEMGLKVMQIGCDPKADSTILLRHGEAVPAVLDLYNEKKQLLQLEDMVRIGYNNVICVEAGGPTPGLGCAGRGIITALEKLKELGAYEVYKPDVVLYDVLGDVVCGGFSMPMRNGYADKVFILTSGENMAIHAAANIAMAVQNFKNRGYAGLGGLILNRRDVPREEEKVAELADDFQTAVIGTLSHSSQVALAEEQQKTLMECYPESEMAEEYRALAVQMYRICGGVLKDENDAVRDEYMHKCMDEHMDKYTDERMNEHINEHINECMNGQTQEDV